MKRDSWLRRIGGPVGSVLLHVGIFALLLKVLVFEMPEEESEVTVEVCDELGQQMESAVEDAAEENIDGDELSDLSEEEPEEYLPEDALAPPDMAAEMKQLDTLDEVAKLDEDLPTMTGVMAGRSEVGRRKMLREFGGVHGLDAEKAVLKGLRWLQDVQCENGSWGVGKSRSMTAKQERTRLTGLALLAFLAHGDTPQSAEFGDVVRRAMQFLLKSQEESGCFCPFSKKVGYHDDIGVYGHAIASYALAEAYGLTRAPVLREPVERAVQVILSGQQSGGGWDHRYQNAQWSDLSVTAWQVQALRAAIAADVKVDGLLNALQQSVRFVQGMHTGDGSFYYRVGNKKPSSGLDYMTGAAVLCLQLAGQHKVPEVAQGLAYLREIECTDWADGWQQTKKNKSFNVAYEWYYSTQAIFQAGGSQWTRWNNRFAPMLVSAQDASGAWKPPSEQTQRVTKDIIYTTGFCVLSLQVYYRILPTFKQVKAAPKPVGFPDMLTVELMAVSGAD